MQLTDIHLESKRLVFREYREGDAPLVARFGGDAEFSRFLSGGEITQESARKFVAKAISDQSKGAGRTRFDLAIVEKASDDLIGGLHLHVDDLPSRRAEFGYAIGPSYQNRGYATEAVARVLAFGFDHLRLYRLFALCDAQNHASVRVLEKAGLPKEGLMRGYKRETKHHWSDWWMFALTLDDWKAQKDLRAN